MWISVVLEVQVQPLFEAVVLKTEIHQSQLLGLKKSIQELLPDQHQPSYSPSPLGGLTRRPLSEASWYAGYEEVRFK
jgi:hypothetical protein